MRAVKPISRAKWKGQQVTNIPTPIPTREYRVRLDLVAELFYSHFSQLSRTEKSQAFSNTLPINKNLQELNIPSENTEGLKESYDVNDSTFKQKAG